MKESAYSVNRKTLKEFSIFDCFFPAFRFLSKACMLRVAQIAFQAEEW